MILQLRQLFEIVGEKKVIDYSINPDDLSDLNFTGSLASPIAIKGVVENRAGVVTLAYSSEFLMHLSCDRCLKEFDREYKYDFEHILIQHAHNDNNEYVVCDDNTLDLNELAISDLLLQLPTKILCREDCRGLCYVCGQDLNEGKCSCS
ncbi:MAG: DUF177 domain-containing protein [Ruminococcus sp.]|nr:DUF177 domain-containing protein [Ruminococcus sp.]